VLDLCRRAAEAVDDRYCREKLRQVEDFGAELFSHSEHGRWERLKACPREECEWAFYDKSKNRSGRWCSMEACGNIEKARAFRERRRGA